MLHVVAVEVLLFMSRRDLDKMCAISTRLETLIALACATYPFRRMRRVDLQAYDDDEDVSKFDVSILDDGDELAFRVCETLEEALTFLAPFYRRTYVDEFEVRVGLYEGDRRVLPSQWTDLTNIFRSGAARHLQFWSTDLSLLGDNAFVDGVRCRRLQVTFCRFRGGLFSDDMLRSCAANGVVELDMWANKTEEEEYAASEDALLEYCLPASGASRVLRVDNLPVSDTFAAKFLERLLAPGRTNGPRGYGSVEFTSKQEQRGLAAYAHHLVPDQKNPTYRFATLRDGDYPYHFIIDYRNHEYRQRTVAATAEYRNKMHFSFGCFDLAPVDE
ncbi:hypothetical protein AAVH_20336 [Aphelenchoides avenae]|nr:hypothetical protein AAVH_20336 [Aphelenchus avenae]